MGERRLEGKGDKNTGITLAEFLTLSISEKNPNNPQLNTRGEMGGGVLTLLQ